MKKVAGVDECLEWEHSLFHHATFGGPFLISSCCKKVGVFYMRAQSCTVICGLSRGDAFVCFECKIIGLRIMQPAPLVGDGWLSWPHGLLLLVVLFCVLICVVPFCKT
jgi:hypothetical protein